MVRRALVALPSFSWKTTCLSTVLLLAEAAGVAITSTLYYFAPVRRNTVLFAALLHLFSIPSGALVRAASTVAVLARALPRTHKPTSLGSFCCRV